MQPGPAVFTLEAVNALVPRLNAIVGQQLTRRLDIEGRLKKLAELSGSGDVPDSFEPSPDDGAAARELKHELAQRIEVYREGWQELENMGAVLKDPGIGLLDFYGRVEGKLVWLCWKYGELEVSHYHALDEGFSARKLLAGGVKHRLLN